MSLVSQEPYLYYMIHITSVLSMVKTNINYNINFYNWTFWHAQDHTQELNPSIWLAPTIYTLEQQGLCTSF